ncbi:hypothetical protein PR048_023281 [Dryococelus australis]|uniref:Uncharacterized protein n=1 Tax=Dryococelus australis TaxID=614101 RepID=A0ABQ9GTM0_9NEOP|nr:hypothetical protein PR048_023281 [Dryococelus australis]
MTPIGHLSNLCPRVSSPTHIRHRLTVHTSLEEVSRPDGQPDTEHRAYIDRSRDARSLAGRARTRAVSAESNQSLARARDLGLRVPSTGDRAGGRSIDHPAAVTILRKQWLTLANTLLTRWRKNSGAGSEPLTKTHVLLQRRTVYIEIVVQISKGTGDSGNVELMKRGEYGAGRREFNRRSPRKSADQRHRPARFPRAKIQQRHRRELSLLRIAQIVACPHSSGVGWPTCSRRVAGSRLRCGRSSVRLYNREFINKSISLELNNYNGKKTRWQGTDLESKAYDPPVQYNSHKGGPRWSIQATRLSPRQPGLGEACGQRVFLGISRLPRPCILALLHKHLASPSSALKISLLRTVRTATLHNSCNSSKYQFTLSPSTRAVVRFIRPPPERRSKQGRSQGVCQTDMPSESIIFSTAREHDFMDGSHQICNRFCAPLNFNNKYQAGAEIFTATPPSHSRWERGGGGNCFPSTKECRRIGIYYRLFWRYFPGVIQCSCHDLRLRVAPSYGQQRLIDVLPSDADTPRRFTSAALGKAVTAAGPAGAASTVETPPIVFTSRTELYCRRGEVSQSSPPSSASVAATRSGFNPRPGHSGFSHLGIVLDGQQVFSGISRLPRPFTLALLHISITLLGSQDYAVKSRPMFRKDNSPLRLQEGVGLLSSVVTAAESGWDESCVNITRRKKTTVVASDVISLVCTAPVLSRGFSPSSGRPSEKPSRTLHPLPPPSPEIEMQDAGCDSYHYTVLQESLHCKRSVAKQPHQRTEKYKEYVKEVS